MRPVWFRDSVDSAAVKSPNQIHPVLTLFGRLDAGWIHVGARRVYKSGFSVSQQVLWPLHCCMKQSVSPPPPLVLAFFKNWNQCCWYKLNIFQKDKLNWVAPEAEVTKHKSESFLELRRALTVQHSGFHLCLKLQMWDIYGFWRSKL